MKLPTVVFITALPCEFKAVADYLTSPQEEQHPQGTIYHLGEYPAKNPRWRVAVAEAGQTNSVAAIETERAVDHFQPEYIFFVGVAGGIKDVALGDVVVAETVKDYERAKVTDDGVFPRGEVGKSSYQLVERAKAVSRNSDWRSKIKRETTVVKKTKRSWFWNTDSGSKAETQPKVLVPVTIATGAKVVGSTKSEIYQFITKNYSDAVAVEMEGIGFLEAVRRNEKVRGIVIRGISDLLAKNAAHDKQWQPIAAENAAAFAFAMLDKLTAAPVKSSSNSTQPFSVPLPRNANFVGRTNVLQQLETLLSDKHVVALHGLGGVGKTQMAIEYAYAHRNEYSQVLWITAETQQGFQHEFQRIAPLLQIAVTHKKEDEARLIAEVTQWFQSHSQWLLIIDNVEEFAPKPVVKLSWMMAIWYWCLPRLRPQQVNELTGIVVFLGAIREHGHILLTTRLPSTRSVAEPLAVEQMAVTEGVQLLLKRARGVEHGFEQHREYAAAKKLVQVLDGLPLALEQAAAYVEGTSNFEKYLQLYQTHQRELLARRGNLVHPLDHPLSVLVTLEMLFSKLQDGHLRTIDLLCCCALLPADDIADEVLQAVFNLDGFEFNKVLTPALHYSLLQRELKTQQLRIHRVVQTVLLTALSEPVQRQWLNRIIGALLDILPPPDEIEQWQVFRRLRPTVMSCVTEIEQFAIKTEPAGRLLNRMGYYLDTIGEYDQALPSYQEALKIREQVLGKQHPDYATSLNNLAGLYRAQGEYEQALPLYQEALKIVEQVLGKQHPDYASSLNNLAGLYRAQGQYEQALPLYQEALKIVEQVLGKQHPYYASSLNNLATLYDDQGQYEQALPLYQEALKINEQVLGKQHPNYASSLNNLAYLYQSQGKYEEALPLYQEALEIITKVLGEQHPNTQSCKRNYLECIAAIRKLQVTCSPTESHP